MNMTEYNKVKDMTYDECCAYLQNKYGIGLVDYMTRAFVKNPKVTRTKEGLFAHHKMEDRMIKLSDPEIARMCPFEWQTKENIVYCDYLEHLLLHVLICKYPSAEKVEKIKVGIGGVVNFLVPELNDIYSGWQPNIAWKKNCADKVKNDKDVYIALVTKFIDENLTNFSFNIEMLLRSYNTRDGVWEDSKNIQIYTQIKNIYKEYPQFLIENNML